MKQYRPESILTFLAIVLIFLFFRLITSCNTGVTFLNKTPEQKIIDWQSNYINRDPEGYSLFAIDSTVCQRIELHEYNLKGSLIENHIVEMEDLVQVYEETSNSQLRSLSGFWINWFYGNK